MAKITITVCVKKSFRLLHNNMHRNRIELVYIIPYNTLLCNRIYMYVTIICNYFRTVKHSGFILLPIIPLVLLYGMDESVRRNRYTF